MGTDSGKQQNINIAQDHSSTHTESYTPVTSITRVTFSCRTDAVDLRSADLSDRQTQFCTACAVPIPNFSATDSIAERVYPRYRPPGPRSGYTLQHRLNVLQSVP